MTPAFDTGLCMPGVGPDHPLAHLRSRVIHKRRPGARPEHGAGHAHWPASFFGLDRVSAFREAPPERQRAVLEHCGRSLLEEAFFIEKAGVAFAAKMVLLAETIDERQLYAMFASDEATHLDQVSRFYTDPADDPAANPFLAFLSRLIEEGDRTALQLVVQVVLEGWGLTHYRAMRDACTSAPLREVFTGILADEAAHHGSGVLLLGDGRLHRADRAHIVDVMAQFLAMVQAGPQGVAGAVEAACGPLSRAGRRRLFEELDAERHGAERLAHLRELMCKTPGASDIADELDRAGCFRPHDPSELS